MQPVIGITCAYDEDTHRAMLHLGYVESVVRAGGIPVMLYYHGPDCPLPNLDGLILSGGGDITPMLFGQSPDRHLNNVQQERDLYELHLIEAYNGIPMLGICRGIQLINIAYGGDVRQHIDGHMLKIYDRHEVSILPKSRLAEMTGYQGACVNSLHHQCVGRPAPGFVVNAWAPGGVVEGIEHERKPVFGVQWHPEKMSGDLSDHLFAGLVTLCSKRGDQQSIKS